MDHLRRRTLKLQNLTMLVLDEADEMLNMGFREDIETILQDVPEQRQTVLFSATMPPEIMEITHQYQKEPVVVKMESRELTVPSIRQFYYEVPAGKKTETLCRLLDYYNPKRSIVFCNTKRMVDELTDDLQFRGYSPDELHGDMKQQARDTVMAAFKSGKVDILIATDVAARGIDVDDIDAVFNYDLPQDYEYYIHRIGRTGRAGKSGTSYTFVSGRRQIYALHDIEKHIKTKIDLKPIPSSAEVSEVKNDKLTGQLLSALEEGKQRKYETVVDKLMEQGFNSVDIACAALKLLADDKQEDSQLDVLIKQQQKEKEKKSFASRIKDVAKGAKKTMQKPLQNHVDKPGSMVTYVLSIGREDKVTPKDIVGTITKDNAVPGKAIGKIAIQGTHSIVDIAKDYAEVLAKKTKGLMINGKVVSVKLKRTPKKKK